MRKIDIWDPKHPEYVEEINLLSDNPYEEYICIRDDLGEVIMVPKDKWNDFVKACQKVVVSP